MLENNYLLKENVVLKWVHRFGIDSLDDLLIHSPVQKENHEEENHEQITSIDENHEEENHEQITSIDENHEEENQEQITSIDENHEEENQEQIKLESFKNLENLEETNCESNDLKISNNNQIFNTNQDSNNVEHLSDTHKLPLPNIKNFRKWINKDKKAS